MLLTFHSTLLPSTYTPRAASILKSRSFASDNVGASDRVCEKFIREDFRKAMVVVGDQIDLEIDRKEVYRYLGYGKNTKLHNRTSSLIDDYIEEAQSIIEPAYSYTIKNIERIEGSRVYIENSVVFESPTVSELLKKCEKVAIFLATINDPLEEVVGHLSEDNSTLQATVLDAVGSVAADQVAEVVEDKVRELANEQGLSVSRRFSPGYCGWDVDQQRAVFEVMNGNSMGIELTEECIMLPRKSVSGIIGIGTLSKEVEGYNPCITSSNRNCCSYRR